ncbi:MAG: transglycosylase domain-containing protein [Myxococcota bacterium]|nr:transglycosylase domain-containing protein [Myxococcota bacterium]
MVFKTKKKRPREQTSPITKQERPSPTKPKPEISKPKKVRDESTERTDSNVQRPNTKEPPKARPPKPATKATKNIPPPKIKTSEKSPPVDSQVKPAKKKRSIFRRLIKYAAIATLVLGVLGAAGGAYAYHYFGQQVPTIDSLRTYSPPTVTVVYDRNNKILAEIYEKRRYVREIATDRNDKSGKIPMHVQDAFIAAEDANFWKHTGVDFVGILRAVARNAAKGKKAQGASTITQQVAKNFLLTSEKTYIRKIKEAILAQRIEKTFPKEHILYLYLNEIYLGSGAYGVEAASRVYFDKGVNELTIAEAAILAGLPQRPSDYSPHKNWKKARARQLYVLNQLLDKNFIDQKQYDSAKSEVVRVIKKDNEFLKQAPYYTEHVRRYLVETYGFDKVYKDGLEVVTACDIDLQKSAQRALKRNVEKADRRAGWKGPKKNIEKDAIQSYLDEQEKQLTTEEVSHIRYVTNTDSDQGGMPAPPDKSTLQKDRWYEAVVTKVVKDYFFVSIGSHKAMIPNNWTRWGYKPNPERSFKRRYQKDMTKVVNEGDVLDVRIEYFNIDEAIKDASKQTARALKKMKKKEKGQYVMAQLMQSPDLEGAIFSYRLTNSSEERKDQGAVLAMVGGTDFSKSEYNRATQAIRQVGSTFKPIVYSSAIESRIFTAGTLLPDAPTVYQTLNNKVWKPGNYGNDFLGNITLRKALMLSRNVCTIRVLEKVSLENIYIQAGPRLGIGYDNPTCTRKHISENEICDGEKSPSPVEGMVWCEKCLPETCPLINMDRAYIKSNSVPDHDFKCMSEMETHNGAQWCRSCDVNLRVCAWVDIDTLPEKDSCIDARLEKGKVKCRSCDMSMALGSSSLTMEELAKAYSVFGSYGNLIEPYFIEKVRDRDGTIIEEHQYTPPQEVLDPSVAAITHWLLTQVATGGTAAKTNRLKLHLAGKTGTTNDYFDAWFVGYNPDIIATSWVGFDKPRSMGVSFTGGDIALPIWMDYMKDAVPKDDPKKNRRFPSMPGIEWAKIDELTGMLATDGIAMPMLPGTSPTNVAGVIGQKTTEDLLIDDY